MYENKRLPSLSATRLIFFVGIIAGFLLSSCSLMRRSPESGYGSASDNRNGRSYQVKEKSLRDEGTHRTALELGLDPSRLSGEETRQIRHRQELRSLERKLETVKEKEQYSKVLPWLKDDEEKVEMLSLPSVEARHHWILRKNIWQRAQKPTEEFKSLIDSQDVAVGMPMDFVRRAWGEPQSVETSGNPTFKNEKWRYVRNISTTDGFRVEKRIVFFEAGRVVGWETE